MSGAGLAAGTYYLEVDAPGGVADASTYELSVGVTGALLTVALNPSAAAENAGTLTAAGSVSVAAAPASPVTVTLVSEDPAQLSFVTNPITIAAGTTAATFDIRLFDDPPAVPDGNRLITITATAPVHNQGSAEFQILDDDIGMPIVSWNKAAETVAETGAPILVLTAVLTQAAAGTVVIPFTVSGTATAGSDFDAFATPHELSIASGTTRSMAIMLFDDSEVEQAETLIITMGTPTNATAGLAEYTLTITDDETGNADGGPTAEEPGGANIAVAAGCACNGSAAPLGAGVFAAGALSLAARLRRRRVRPGSDR